LGKPQVRIIDYQAQHRAVFRDLNLAWIERYFEIEAMDRISLGDPDQTIIRPGGAILMAEYDGQIVGVCALIRINEQCLELAKMAVSPTVQGLGIGWQLGQAVLERAGTMGATRVFLETNSVLKPAIALYEKLGFHRVTGRPSHYCRVDIQMEIDIDRG